MHLSYKTLKKFIPEAPEVKLKDLAEIMTMSVVEVEGFVAETDKFNRMVLGQVLEVKNHPKADKLKLALVDLGKDKAEVVCGGINLHEGMKIAFAYPGAVVRWHGQGEWQPLSVATIRGVESRGMICAAAEIGLVDSNEPEHGIMDLSYLESNAGTSLAEALGKDDLILEIDNKSVTHRPDLWGHWGMARELASLWKTNLVLPELSEIKPDGGEAVKLDIKVKDQDLCQRYLGVALGEIKIEPSPLWLKNRVESLGMRSINNVVDLANYVMLEMGQPLHTFDLKKLSGPKITVRRAKRGESIITLDGEERSLPHDALVIADDKKAVAIAGIIGGQESEVDDNTSSLLIESATFNSISVRQTATALGLRTEASARFEKALDTNLALLAIKRFVYLLKEICPSLKVVSELVDVYPTVPILPSINISYSWLQDKIGSHIKPDDIKDILERLGFEVWNKDKDEMVVKVPSWRATRDITTREDLIEEVARVYGYGNIKPVLPKFEIKPPVVDGAQSISWKIRELLVGAGWMETLSYSFVGDKTMHCFGSQYHKRHIITELCLELTNPVDGQQNMLRPSLLPNLLDQAAGNLRWFESVHLFEIGRVFINQAGNLWIDEKELVKLPKQPFHLSLLMAVKKGNDELAFRQVKGVLVGLGLRLGFSFNFRKPSIIEHDWYQKERVLDILIGDEIVGHVGILNTELINSYNMPEASVAVEISLEALPLEPTFIQYQPIGKFPEVSRDLSIVISRDISWENIASALKNISPLLKLIEPFDIYQSASLGDKKSVAFHLMFRDPERTLTSDEVDKIMEDAKNILIKKIQAEIRDH